jgi:uncharacterized phage-associated protein
VIPNVYHEFKVFGNQSITETGTTWEMGEGSDGKKRIRIVRPQIPEEDIRTNKLLKKIIDVYGKFTAAQLSTMTHEAGSPWDRTRESNPNRKGVDIPDDLIKQYFKKRIKT